MPLLVDEAHGGHFAFLRAGATAETASAPTLVQPHANSSPAPPSPPPPSAAETQRQKPQSQSQSQSQSQPCSALSCGADLVVQSTHKVLGALTQVITPLRQPLRQPAAAPTAVALGLNACWHMSWPLLSLAAPPCGPIPLTWSTAHTHPTTV